MSRYMSPLQSATLIIIFTHNLNTRWKNNDKKYITNLFSLY